MSEFSEYLQHLIQDRDISISRLARDSGVERTAIHKALSGDRILPYRAVELLDFCLKLSPKESKRFRQYYNQLFESEAVGRARSVIDNFFMYLSDLGVQAFNIRGQFQDIPFQKKNLYKGYADISLLLQFMIEEEMKNTEPRIELTVPSNILAIRECIEKIYNSKFEMVISHIICLDTSETEKEYNLHNLEYAACLLPACMLSERQYEVYYYYSNAVQSGYTDPLPYFFVTHAGAICFSENCQTAFYWEGIEQVEYFHACFYNLKRSCHKFIEYMEEDAAIVKILSRRDMKEKYCSISAPFYIPQVCAEKVISLFTRKNVMEFLNREEMYDFSNGIKKIISKDECLKLMYSFLESISNNHIKGKMINDILFSFPYYFGMVTSVGAGTFLFDKDRNFVMWIQESDICRAFYDWSIYFSNSECVCDKEKTVEMLTEILKM